MKEKSTIKQINRRYQAHMKALTKGASEKDILEALANGKNNYMRVDRTESSSFDRTWIDVIEGVIFDLGDIVMNPRLVTRTEGNIVPVELARKTNADSVQHLASHTQYIKEIDEFGNVVPSKILTIMHDDDIKTYENRFIATFIRRLVLFVEKRYEVVAKMAQLRDQESLMVKNSSIIDGCEVEIETIVKVSHPHNDPHAIETNSYIQRIENMRNYLLYFYHSAFMHALRNEKDVHNPILQTNIIRKNPKYHHCYEVYRFIESYTSLGVNYKVNENYSIFNDEELNEINRTLFANFITLNGRDGSKNAKKNSKVYKPRILTAPDDEAFVYGDQSVGPIEFVRTDAFYREYLASKLRDDLPLHPTKQEKEYYADEFAAKDEFRQDEKQLNDLLNRVEKEVNKFNEEAEKIELDRELAKQELERRQKAAIKVEEGLLLEEAREEIVRAATADEEARKAREEEERRKFLESIKPAEEPVPMSHPYTRPVTFEQACIDLWPILERPQERHIYREEPVQYLPREEKPVPAPAPVEEAPEQEVTHPEAEHLTYDEAVKQIWPQIRDVEHDFNKEEEPERLPEPEEVPAEPIPVPVPAPVEEPQEEQPQEEAPQEEQPAPIPVPVPVPAPKREPKPRIPGEFVVLTKEGFYVSKSKRAATIKEAKVFNEYHEAKGIAKLKDGKVIRKSDLPNRPVPAPAPAPAPQPEPVKEEPKQPAPKTKIPGRFVVVTKEGYYISKTKRTNRISEARVFNEYHEAKGIAKLKEGKVVKL